MPKILLSISDRQHKALKERSEQHGVTVSEFVRRILDLFLNDAPCKGKSSFGKDIACPLITPDEGKKDD